MEVSSKSFIGGAHIGGWFGLHATWPFAKLTVCEESIMLDMGFLGHFVFDSTKVSNIEPYGFIPFIATGIRIEHSVPSYPKKIIFWTIAASAKPLLSELRSFGYNCFTK